MCTGGASSLCHVFVYSLPRHTISNLNIGAEPQPHSTVLESTQNGFFFSFFPVPICLWSKRALVYIASMLLVNPSFTYIFLPPHHLVGRIRLCLVPHSHNCINLWMTSFRGEEWRILGRAKLPFRIRMCILVSVLPLVFGNHGLNQNVSDVRFTYWCNEI